VGRKHGAAWPNWKLALGEAPLQLRERVWCPYLLGRMVRCLFGVVVSPKAGRNGQDMATGSRLAVQPLPITAALLAFYFLDRYVK
jgi:hypothetical protein